MKWLIRSFFRTLRLLLGPIVLLWEKLTTPKGMERTTEQQQWADRESALLALYQFKTCPFCIKVRREIKRLSLNLQLNDAQHDPEHRQALLQGGGELKVPCLRIDDGQGEVTWMYESDEIIKFLRKRFLDSNSEPSLGE